MGRICSKCGEKYKNGEYCRCGARLVGDVCSCCGGEMEGVKGDGGLEMIKCKSNCFGSERIYQY